MVIIVFESKQIRNRCQPSVESTPRIMYLCRVRACAQGKACERYPLQDIDRTVEVVLI